MNQTKLLSFEEKKDLVAVGQRWIYLQSGSRFVIEIVKAVYKEAPQAKLIKKIERGCNWDERMRPTIALDYLDWQPLLNQDCINEQF